MFFRRRIPFEPVTIGRAASRYDFLDSLRLLGAKLDVPHHAEVDSIPCEMQRVSLSLSRETWERTLGPPENITSHYAPQRHELYHTWEHHWVGGSVTCVGCLFERTSECRCPIEHSSDCRWALLYRVLFFNDRDASAVDKSKPHPTRCRVDFHPVRPPFAEVGESGCQVP